MQRRRFFSRSLHGELQSMLNYLAERPLLSVALSVAGFAFLGPLAALLIVATMLDHEFAHMFMMKRLGYAPGPVRIVPLLGAFVRAGRPMLRSSDIALIYLAGPLAGILSAAAAAFVAMGTLDSQLSHQVLVGTTTAVGLNLFNLLPFEPLDGGLICRAVPYPTLLLFPVCFGLWLACSGHLDTPGGVVLLYVVTLAAVYKVNKWRHYVATLRRRMEYGDATGLQEWQASFQVPFGVRAFVVCAYILSVGGGCALLIGMLNTIGWSL